MKKQFSLTDKWLITAVTVVSLFLIATNSFVILNPGQAGVITILGKAREGVLLEGIHLKPPLVSTVDIYDSQPGAAR